MTFTGTMIEDLMATVERAELRAHSDETMLVEALAIEPMLVEPLLEEPLFAEAAVGEAWFASSQESADYNSKFTEAA